MPSLSALTHRLRVLVRDTAVIRYTRHAQERMRERDVTIGDAEHILTNGQVCGTDMHLRSRRELLLVEGRDLEGRRCRLVVDASQPALILVVTVIDLK